MRSHRAKIHPAKFALFVLLAMQLVVGLQLQAAQPVHVAQPGQATQVLHVAHPVHVAAPDFVADSRPDCATHSNSLSSHTTTEGGHKSMGGHACCHAGACQCHCVNPPASIDLPLLANIATSVAIPLLPSAQFLGPRIDEFLRPPIA